MGRSRFGRVASVHNNLSVILIVSVTSERRRHAATPRLNLSLQSLSEASELEISQ